MKSSRLTLLLATALLLAGGAADEHDDKLRAAIASKTREQLEMICTQASIPFAAGGDLDEIRAKVLEYAQRERPGAGAPKPAKADAAEQKTPEQQQTEMMFKAMDTNRDGKLSEAEMKTMIDKVNAAATAQGQASVKADQIFAVLDANKDGSVDRTEVAGLAELLSGKGKQQPAKAAAPSAKDEMLALNNQDGSSVAEGIFKMLDKDWDGRLSRDEMQPILEQTKAYNKAQGIEEDADFWETLDADKSGYVDQAEATSFFTAMGNQLKASTQAGAAPAKPRDEL